MMNMDVSSSTSSESRLGQWSMEETKELVGIRAELDQSFMETKRNKQLWQLISNSMRLKGYLRSPEQCKCKWKNLVTRYKGCETGESESTKQQFPFYNELQTIFTSRMQRMVMAEAEGSGGGSRKNKAVVVSSEEEEEDQDMQQLEDEDNMSIERDHHHHRRTKKMKKSKNNDSSNNHDGGLKEIVEELMRQHMRMESEWMEAVEAREKERKEREREWKETMEALEKERMMMDQRWREREEQRRVREEARAQRRDALITALLNKLTRQDNMTMAMRQ
ncbi:trihelix transcription factor GT-3b-like [Senna tora]|uniref:Trihelix transcription factor GT-3b-like n=1 Tax=Senna tora TaxID=362788 RepID=A0A834WJI8_9FABA|nr:trihelix transcription factor GT-3b-like [Senna tora]